MPAATSDDAFGRATGTVVAFDEDAGLGTVAEDGGPEHPFHCTAIADGTRTIEVGARVRYRVAAGLLGRWEARSVEPEPEPGSRSRSEPGSA